MPPRPLADTVASQRVRRSIKAKVILLLVSVSMLGIVGMAISSILLLRQSLKADAMADLQVMAAAKAEEIDRFFTSKRDGLRVLSNDSELDVLSQGSSTITPRERADISAFLSRTGLSMEFYDSFVIDTSGTILETALHENDLGQNLYSGLLTESALTRAFEAALTPEDMGGIPTSFYPPSNRHAAFLASPIRRDGRLVGVLAAQINVVEESPFMSFAPGAASSLELVVGTSSAGNVQMLSPLKKRDGISSSVVSDVTLAQPMRQALMGQYGTDIDQDYVGDSVLASWVPMERWGLGVVVKVDLDEVLEPAKRLARRSLWLVLVAAMIMAMVAWWAAGTLSRRIRRLEDATRRVAEGSMDVSVPEEGSDEVTSLAHSFNTMVLKLKESMTTREELEHEIALRTKAEKERNEYVKLLQASNRDLEQFAYVASHDLQEPLRMVSSYTQLLERRYKDQLDDTAGEFIHYAVDGAQRMQRLINDLLQYSRVSTRGDSFTNVDMHDVVGSAIATARLSPGGEDVLFLVDELPTVHADKAQLERLVTNLFTNAVKFRGEETPAVRIHAKEASEEWIFAVEDNGIGIDPEFRERIFLIFQRLNERGKYPGTGLGLAICKRIVQRHNGRIWVESRDQGGSIFRFSLPKHNESDHE